MQELANCHAYSRDSTESVVVHWATNCMALEAHIFLETLPKRFQDKSELFNLQNSMLQPYFKLMLAQKKLNSLKVRTLAYQRVLQ